MPTPTHPIAVVGAAIVDSLARPTRLLAARRSAPAALAGGWEVPGGKVDPGETEPDALVREIREELGVGLVLGPALVGPMDDGRFRLGDAHAMRVWLGEVEGDPAPLEDHDELRWLAADQLWDVAWLPGDVAVVQAAVAHLGA